MDIKQVMNGLEEAETMLIRAVDRGGEMAVMGAFKCLNRVTEAITMLKEQPEIILCKDCKHRYKGWCCAKHHVLEEVKADFFCGDGERKE